MEGCKNEIASKATSGNNALDSIAIVEAIKRKQKNS